MLKFKMDQTHGATLRQTAVGLEAERLAYITGITDLQQAMAHPNLPHVGQSHPAIPHLVVGSLVAKHDGPNSAKIIITYHNPAGTSDKPKVSIGTALRQLTTETDLAGNRITVAYANAGMDDDTLTQGARVAVLRPQTELTFTRLENTHPVKTAQIYAGTVNRSSIFQGDPGTWLCTSIDGQSEDGGTTFLVTYLFQHNIDGWQPTVSYNDPKTNRPPADLLPGIGIKQVTLYKQEEFRNLGLGS